MKKAKTAKSYKSSKRDNKRKNAEDVPSLQEEPFAKKYPTIAEVLPQAVLLDEKSIVRKRFAAGGLDAGQVSALTTALQHFRDTIRGLWYDVDNMMWCDEKLHDDGLEAYKKLTEVYQKLVATLQRSGAGS